MIQQILTLGFIAIFIGLSQTAGIGGGPIINVCLMLSNYYNHNPQQQPQNANSQRSISLTYLFLIGGSIASIWKNFIKKNPQTNKTYFNIDLVLITLPIMNAGSMIGSLFKSYLSEFAITILFILVFGMLINQIWGNLKSMKQSQLQANIVANKNENKSSTGNREKQNEFVQLPDNSTSRSQIQSMQDKPADDIAQQKQRKQQSKGEQKTPRSRRNRRKKSIAKMQTKESNIQLQQKDKKENAVATLQKSQKQNKPKPVDLQNKKIIWFVILAIVFYIIAVIFSLLKGGNNYSSIVGIDPCGIIGYFIVFLYLVMSLFVTLFNAKKIITLRQIQNSIDLVAFQGELHKQKIETNQIIQIKDSSNNKSSNQSQQAHQYQIKQKPNIHKIPITQQKIKKYIIAGFSAGVLGSTLAIGGAPILIPIWLSSGINHNVAANSTAALILNSALIAATIAIFNGAYKQIPYSQILLYLFISFVSSAIIKEILHYFAQKYKLKYLVVILLLIIVVVSMFILVPMQIAKYQNDYDDFMKFGSLC